MKQLLSAAMLIIFQKLKPVPYNFYVIGAKYFEHNGKTIPVFFVRVCINYLFDHLIVKILGACWVCHKCYVQWECWRRMLDYCKNSCKNVSVQWNLIHKRNVFSNSTKLYLDFLVVFLFHHCLLSTTEWRSIALKILGMFVIYVLNCLILHQQLDRI